MMPTSKISRMGTTSASSTRLWPRGPRALWPVTAQLTNFPWFPNVHIEALQAISLIESKTLATRDVAQRLLPKLRSGPRKVTNGTCKRSLLRTQQASPTAAADVFVLLPASRKRLFAYMLQLTSLPAASLQRKRKVRSEERRVGKECR